MNNDVNLYVVLKELFTQKKHAEYIRYFVENQRDFQQNQALDGEQRIQILNWLAESFVQEKDLVQARRFFEYLMKVAPTDSRAYLGFINLLKNEKQWQELAQFCHLVQTQFPNLWQSYWWLGQAHKYLKQYDQAEAQFQHLLTHFPKSHLGFQGFTETSTLQKDWQQVIHYGSQLQAKKPTMWQGYWWLGQAYKNLKQYDKAQEQFTLLKEKFPNSPKGQEGLEQLAKFKEAHPN